MSSFSSMVSALTLKQEARYSSWTTCPMLVFDAWGNRASSFCTTNSTRTFLDRADPSSSANSTSFRASSCMAVIQTDEDIQSELRSVWTRQAGGIKLCSGVLRLENSKWDQMGKSMFSHSESALWAIITDSQAQTHTFGFFNIHFRNILDYLQLESSDRQYYQLGW